MRLSIRGEGSLDLPLRILNLFAQQGVACDQASFVLEAESYRILIDAPAPGERHELIVDKLRSMVLVSEVEVLDS